MSMKKMMHWMLAATLICGATLFASCTNEDNPVKPTDNLAEKIIGKWITADMNGQPAPTNEKKVITFVSATKCYMSASLSSRPVAGTQWLEQLETDVSIDGNKMTLTGHPKENTTTVDEYTITHINDNEFTANRKLTIKIDGNVVVYSEDSFHYVKVNRDYKEAILGTWEGHVTNSEGSVYDDGETHRWEYKDDGTYVYYVKDGDDWVPYEGNTLNEYFVDGTLLCTRWIDNDVENREWWEIVSIKDGVMKWKGLRANEDGTTYTATFEMKKVE